MSGRPIITFRPLAEADFPLLTEWRNRPHLVGVYADRPTDLYEVTAKYGPRVRGEEAVIQHIASVNGRPFGFLQSYRTADWPQCSHLRIGSCSKPQ